MTFGWGAEKANVVSCVALQFALCHDHRSSVGHVAIPDSFQQKLDWPCYLFSFERFQSQYFQVVCFVFVPKSLHGRSHCHCHCPSYVLAERSLLCRPQTQLCPLWCLVSRRSYLEMNQGVCRMGSRHRSMVLRN